MIIISYVIYENISLANSFLFRDDLSEEQTLVSRLLSSPALKLTSWDLEIVWPPSDNLSAGKLVQLELIGRLDSGIDWGRRSSGVQMNHPQWREVWGHSFLSMMWWLIGSKSGSRSKLWKRCTATLQILTRRLICGQAVGFVQLMIDWLKYILQLACFHVNFLQLANKPFCVITSGYSKRQLGKLSCLLRAENKRR